MQQLLSAMSSGMAVALYSTLAGLVTSTLLKLQYYLLDSALAKVGEPSLGHGCNPAA